MTTFLLRAGDVEDRGKGERVTGIAKASYRQVWPVVARQKAGSGETAVQFDVLDVDTTNFPTLNCDTMWTLGKELPNLDWPGASACGRDDRLALSIAGKHNGYGTSYYQIKDPPEDEAGLEAIKEALVPCHGQAGPCTYSETTTLAYLVDGVEKVVSERKSYYENRGSVIEVEIIPVKYSFIDLWQWSLVLDRFAESRDNTIGIRSASVGPNHESYAGDLILWPLADLGPVGKVTSPNGLSVRKAAELRETIVVWSINAQLTVDFLPALLPQLGIPVDAVGVVVEERVRPGGRMEFAADVGERQLGLSKPIVARLASDLGVPVSVAVGLVGGGTLVVIGMLTGGVILTARLRRRSGRAVRDE